jgi:hypothetical protein
MAQLFPVRLLIACYSSFSTVIGDRCATRIVVADTAVNATVIAPAVAAR